MTVPVAFTAVVLAVPAPVPGTKPTVFPFALEAGMPITSGPVPAAPLTTPVIVRVLPAVAAKPPPVPKATGRNVGVAPPVSRFPV